MLNSWTDILHNLILSIKYITHTHVIIIIIWECQSSYYRAVWELINFFLNIFIFDWERSYFSEVSVVYWPKSGWWALWSRYALSSFLGLKSWRKEEKARNLMQNLAQNVFFSLHQNSGLMFYSQKKLLDQGSIL